MSAETEALQAAADQLLAFVTETKKSNIRIIHGQDIGMADHIVLAPTPAVDAWSDDLLIVTHVASPNIGGAPDLKVSALPAIQITLPDGSAPLGGDVADIAVFKVENTGTVGGPRARLMFLGPAAMLTRLTNSMVSSHWGVDSGTVANNPIVTPDTPVADINSGFVIYFTFNMDISGASTLKIVRADGSQFSAPLRRPDNTATKNGDGFAGRMTGVVFDGVRFRLLIMPEPLLATTLMKTFSLTAPLDVDNGVVTKVPMAGVAAPYASITAGSMRIEQDGMYFIKVAAHEITTSAHEVSLTWQIMLFVDGVLASADTDNWFGTGTNSGNLRAIDTLVLTTGQVVEAFAYIGNPADSGVSGARVLECSTTIVKLK